MNTAQSLQDKIDETNEEIRDLDSEINDITLDIETFDKSEHVDKSELDELLNADGPVTVAGIEFNPSYILEELDPTAYSEQFNNWVDGISLENIEEYNDLVERLEELEDSLADRESDLVDYYDELETLEDED